LSEPIQAWPQLEVWLGGVEKGLEQPLMGGKVLCSCQARIGHRRPRIPAKEDRQLTGFVTPDLAAFIVKSAVCDKNRLPRTNKCNAQGHL
jgi:hypothetical protein